MSTLKNQIEKFFAAGASAIDDPSAMAAFEELRSALEWGEIRAAEPDPASPAGWRVNAWVKQGILLGFRLGRLEETQCPLCVSQVEGSSRHPGIGSGDVVLRVIVQRRQIRPDCLIEPLQVVLRPVQGPLCLLTSPQVLVSQSHQRAIDRGQLLPEAGRPG